MKSAAQGANTQGARIDFPVLPLGALCPAAQQQLLVPDGVDVFYDKASGLVTTRGLGELDSVSKHFMEIIVVEDALNARFRQTGIFTPRTYKDSLPVKPQHLVAQAVVMTKATPQTGPDIARLAAEAPYGRTTHDKLWLGRSPLDNIPTGMPLMLMNRRTGGWDGSVERPVIELFGAGGHVAGLYDEARGRFASMTPEDTIVKEAEEELKVALSLSQLVKFGGYYNRYTCALVVVFGVFLEWDTIPNIAIRSLGNMGENTDGIYIAPFEDVMALYAADASAFAGGEAAKPTNFPSDTLLMQRIRAGIAGFHE